MKLCEECQKFTWLELPELPVSPDECEQCQERRRMRAEQARDNAEQVALFIANIGEIPRSKEWKERLINRILPPN